MPKINPQLISEVKKLEHMVQHQNEALTKKEMMLNAKESHVRQGLESVKGPRSLEANLKSALPGFLVPGNVGDINRVLWPFFFATEAIEIPVNSNIRTSINVTQEAAFVWMSYVKVIYLKTEGPDNLEYIRADFANDYNESGLSFTISDPQSGRSFFNSPIETRQVGDPMSPSVLPVPQLILPNAVMDVNFTNANSDKEYFASLIFIGYRLRIDGAQNLLSTIYG